MRALPYLEVWKISQGAAPAAGGRSATSTFFPPSLQAYYIRPGFVQSFIVKEWRYKAAAERRAVDAPQLLRVRKASVPPRASERAVPNYWILKTDADTYPFETLAHDRRTVWDGITNALALKHVRAMAEGDQAMIYHSGVDKAIVGLATIVRGPYPDPKAKDPKLTVVDLEAGARLPTPVSLATIKADPAFADLGLVRMSRLSVIPVPPAQWRRLLSLAGAGKPD